MVDADDRDRWVVIARYWQGGSAEGAVLSVYWYGVMRVCGIAADVADD